MNWISKKYLPLYILLLISIAIKGYFIFEIKDTSLMQQHTFGDSDMNFFHIWSDTVAQGDLIQDYPLRPQHSWVNLVVDKYKEANPSLAAQDNFEIWFDLMGGKAYNQGPIYPYTWGAIKAFISENIWIFIWLQVLMLLGCELLLFSVTRRTFDYKTGLIAFALAIGSGICLFYAGVTLRITFISFFSLLLVWGGLRIFEQNTLKNCVIFGVIFGLSFLTKAVLLLLALGLIAFLIFKYKKEALIPTGAIAIAFLLTISPFVLRNIQVGAPPFKFSSQGAHVIANSNNPGYNPETGYGLSFNTTINALPNCDGSTLKALTIAVGEFDSINEWIDLLWRKFIVSVNGFEVPNNVSYYHYKDRLTSLQLLPINFYLLFPLALGGIVLAFYRKKNIIPYLLIILSNIFLLTLFHTLSRTKNPMYWGLFPLAAFLIKEIYEFVKSKEFKALGITIGAVILGFILTTLPFSKGKGLNRIGDNANEFRQYSPQINESVGKQEIKKAQAIFKEFIDNNAPEFTLKPFKIKTDSERALGNYYGGIFHQYADMCKFNGDMNEYTKFNELSKALQTDK